ncbi:hypothetical protein Plhal304r1_c006g0024451 [Plasmopara halstedii]
MTLLNTIEIDNLAAVCRFSRQTQTDSLIKVWWLHFLESGVGLLKHNFFFTFSVFCSGFLTASYPLTKPGFIPAE